MGDERHTNNVRKLREAQLISKAELARKAGVSPLTIDRVESGKPSRMDTKRKIILALGLKLSDRHHVFPEDVEEVERPAAPKVPKRPRREHEARGADESQESEAEEPDDAAEGAGPQETREASSGVLEERGEPPPEDLQKARFS